jgi:hypothetical protein
VTDRSLAAPDILNVWEWGRARHHVDRALLLLGAAYPELGADTLETLSIAERDRLLLRVRVDTIGEGIAAAAHCAHCGTELEFSFHAGTLLGGAPPEAQDVLSGEVDGIRYRVRRPHSRDLAAIASLPDVEEAAARLFALCLIEAGDGDGGMLSAQEVPAEAIERIAESIAGEDPAADVTFDVHCPCCGASSTVLFDIATFLWSEIETSAQRLLGEVAELARAFGWRERDILAMSPARRSAYLAMAV